MTSKKLSWAVLLALAISYNGFSQVGIGTTGPDASSILEISSTTQGILLPRMTTAQRNAIVSPATGLTLYNSTTNQYQYNIGTPAAPVWNTLATSNVGQSFKYSNTDITTNVNPATAVNVPLFGTLNWNDNNSLYVVSGNQVTITQAGRYSINVNIAITSTVQRASPEIRITVNGTAVGTYGSTGYIRSMGSHNESSINFTEVLQLNANDVVRITGSQGASSGAVTMRNAGSSNVYIEKKS